MASATRRTAVAGRRRRLRHGCRRRRSAFADAARRPTERHPVLVPGQLDQLCARRRSVLLAHRKRQRGTPNARRRRHGCQWSGGFHRPGGDAPLRRPLVVAGRDRHRLYAGGRGADSGDVPPRGRRRRRSGGRAALSVRRRAERRGTARLGGGGKRRDTLARLGAGGRRLSGARAVRPRRHSLRAGAVAGSETAGAAPIQGRRLARRIDRDVGNLGESARQPDVSGG